MENWVYEIGNQMVLADIVVEDECGNEIKDDIALQILRNPNHYRIYDAGKPTQDVSPSLEVG
ncbi:hypothetical protein BLX06_29755 [Bacillus cereus]|uniref:Uncharacterized protein n=1 Tax=Bacillus cereus TaxID=1396 RepID=A0A9X6B3Y6_BACCE|nr:hypothetical protein BLX06_29755 [Bacillus cereus]